MHITWYALGRGMSGKLLSTIPRAIMSIWSCHLGLLMPLLFFRP